MRAIYLPESLARPLNKRLTELFSLERGTAFDAPDQEPSLCAPDSVAWRLYRNPITVFIGGVSSVYMQLAEPSVRNGVWENSSFRENPEERVRRTGLAAMITVYGTKTQALKMIEKVNRAHEHIQCKASDGTISKASDPRLLSWVFNTANIGFSDAYHRFGPGLSAVDYDNRLDQAADNIAPLWGVDVAVRSAQEADHYIKSQLSRLEPHPILDEYTTIMQNLSLMPKAMRPVQRLLVRAAVSNIPQPIRDKVGLDERYGLRPGEESLVRSVGRIFDKVHLQAHPSVRACARLGLPEDYLVRPVNDNHEVSTFDTADNVLQARVFE